MPRPYGETSRGFRFFVLGSALAAWTLLAARTVRADASIATHSRLGVLLVPLTLAGALAALWGAT